MGSCYFLFANIHEIISVLVRSNSVSSEASHELLQNVWLSVEVQMSQVTLAFEHCVELA